jgi:hypothetical protein
LPAPADLGERNFHPPAPNRLWVPDLTYVRTCSGFTYVTFTITARLRTLLHEGSHDVSESGTACGGCQSESRSAGNANVQLFARATPLRPWLDSANLEPPSDQGQ